MQRRAWKIVLTVCAILLGAATVFGLGTPTPPNFEAASVKLSAATDSQSRFETNPGSLMLSNQTLRGCIRAAYGGGGMPLRDWQVVGGPKWIDSERYNIVGKAQGPATGAQLVQMLQTLLIERFKLVIHRESQLSSGYALIVARGGLKMKADSAEGDPPRAIPTRGLLKFERAPLAWLPRMLSNVVAAPVIDEVKIPGVFTFKLEWDQSEWEPRGAVDDKPTGVSVSSALQDTKPSLFSAVQQQLGLKLEPRKIPVDTIVIDRAEKPALD